MRLKPLRKMNNVFKPEPIALSIITGFLGSGKTTLLNQLLRDPALRNTVVIVNEFGKIGLDHDLIVSTDETITLLSSGCICCTIRDDLVVTLENLLRKRDNNRIAPFKRVIIETTGLSDPLPILQTIMGHKYLSLRYQLDSVITLVDAVNGIYTLAQFEEAVKQVAVADVLVISKKDLCDNAQIERVTDALVQINASAKLVENTAINAEILSFKPYNIDINYAEHKHNTHDKNIISFSFSSPVPVSRRAYNVFIELLTCVHGANLLRVKGIVYLSDQPNQPIVVQGAQHVFHPPISLECWPSVERATKLVFIVRGIKRDLIEKLWSALSASKMA